MFAAASAAIRLLSVSAQIIVPYAAHMAHDHRRRRTVGTVMNGLLLGILFARTLSGFVSHIMGWRTVSVIGAAMMWRLLPPQPATAPAGAYLRLLASAAELFGTQQVLRRRALCGACVFASFSAFWTGATFLLAGEPYHYSDAVIGLFGLCGVAGALSASFAGRLSDRGLTLAGTRSFLFLTMASFALSAWGSRQLAGVILGTIVLDLGVQGTQILNQSQIYQLGSAEHSRLTAAYMTPFFLGGAAGSAKSMLAYRAGGWTAVCGAGAAFAGIGFLRWLVEAVGSKTRRRPAR